MNDQLKKVLIMCGSENVQLNVIDDQLNVSFDKNISDELMSLLKKYKTDLTQVLSVHQQRQTEDSHSQDIERISREASEYVLSSAQQRLWLIDRIENGSSQYNIPTVLSIQGIIDISAVEYALKSIIKRHAPLRTVFSDGPVQIVSEQFDFNVNVIDLVDFKEPNKKQHCKTLIQKQALKTFDLKSDLMLNAQIIMLDQDHSVLSLCVHHIAFDGWSMNILLKEFLKNYHTHQKKGPVPCEQLSIEYLDYAHWQQNWLKSPEAQSQLNYWLKQLEGLPEVHQLPLDFIRPEKKLSAGKAYKNRLDHSLTQKLIILAKTEKVTMFMLLHTLWAFILCRFSNENEIVIGTPVANRKNKQLNDLIGFFANTLVMRTHIEHADFASYLKFTKKVHINAQENQDFPFELLVEDSKVKRSIQYAPLFQIMFSMIDRSDIKNHIDGLTVSPVANDVIKARFDMDLTTEIIENQLHFNWIYDQSLFTHETIENMYHSLVHVIDQITKNIHIKLAQLSICNHRQFLQMMRYSQGRQVTLPSNRLIHHLFESMADAYPDHLAIIHHHQKINYQKLNQQANQCAHLIRHKGVKTGDLIGIAMNKSIEMIIVMLGILKSGATYVPLDIKVSEKRLAMIAENCQLTYIFSVDSCQINRSQHDVIDFDQQTLIGFDKGSLKNTISNETSAYVLHTSGTTGTPKGVEVSHRSILNFVLSMSQQPGIQKSDRLLSVTPATFDIFGLELYLPLSYGATMVLANHHDNYQPESLIALMDKHDITIMQATPALWQMIIEKNWVGKQNLTALTGGESTSEQLAKALINKTQQVWNMYGPTETTIWSTCGQLLVNENEPSVVHIGKPIANTQVYILDRSLNLVPQGVVGQIFIAGEGLAKGYVGQVQLTDSVFIHHQPLLNKNDVSTRIYATGDLGKYTTTSQLIHLGRIDDQIKIRGHRIEPKEIETAIDLHPKIKQSMVVLYNNNQKSTEAELVAFYTKTDEANIELSVTELRQHLIEYLPNYMLPNKLIALDKFELNAHGKKDRSSLPDPQLFNNQLNNKYVAPQSILENNIINGLKKIIKCKKIGIYDNFFELGASSIDLVRLADLLKTECDIQLSPIELFQYPNTHKLVEHLSDKKINNNTRSTQISAARNRLKKRRNRKLQNG